MKLYIYISLIILNFSALAQERKANEFDTIRCQGYFVIETNGSSKSDIPIKYLFIPLENIEQDFETSFLKNSEPSYNNLYIPTPYVFNSNDLFELNVFRKKFTDSKEELKLKQLFVPIEDLINKSKILYEFKEKSSKFPKTFKIIYIDGV